MRYLIAALAALALAGCGGNSEAATGSTARPSPEDAYISQLEKTVPTYVVEPERARFIELGYDACKTLSHGQLDDATIAATWAQTQGIERDQAADALQSARDNLCPDA